MTQQTISLHYLPSDKLRLTTLGFLTVFFHLSCLFYQSEAVVDVKKTSSLVVQPVKRSFGTTQRPYVGVSTIPRSILDLDRIDLNCPVECACQRGYINCTSRSLRQVPTKNRRTNYTTFLPHAMWLNDNHFGAAITANNFSDWLMLKTLSLRNCSVRRVAALTFATMPRLAILDLSFNRGGLIVDALAFSGTNLEALLLDDNPGIIFSEKSFENATIRSVRIRRCRLATLSPDVFLPLANSIESLVASENQITSINPRFETMFTSISFFDVSKNPWICDCSIEWLVRVFVSRLNRTRSLNPVDEFGSASGHGLPVPVCVTPSQRNGILVDSLRLGSSDFACSAASVIGIDVEQLRERNQTRFRCSAAGDPVATVSWHFPRAEDEYHWALSVVENTTTVVSPNAYSSSVSPGIVVVSQAFLTVSNRPAITISNGFTSTNQVRLVCKAVNSMGSASLMTNFDVTQRQNEISPLLPKPDTEVIKSESSIKVVTPKRQTVTTRRQNTAAVTQRPNGQEIIVTPQKLLTDNVQPNTKQSTMTTNIPIGYDDGPSSNRRKNEGNVGAYEPIWIQPNNYLESVAHLTDPEAMQTVENDAENTSTPVVNKWQDGDNVGMNQQSIPQGILVTVAVLVAIVMSSLGGCCLVIACSTSKVPNCPNFKRAPMRCRESSLTVPHSVSIAQQSGGEVLMAPPHPKSSLQDRRPLLKPRYTSADTDDSGGKLASEKRHTTSSHHGSNQQNHRHHQQEKHFSPGNNRQIYTPPPQTFSTFRSATVNIEDHRQLANEQSQDDPLPPPPEFLPKPVTLSAFQSPRAIYTASPPMTSRDDAYFDGRSEMKRRYQAYYGRGHRSNLGLTLFLSPPPPAPPPMMMDDVALNDVGAEINRNSSNSYPGDIVNQHHHHHHHQRFLSNSHSEMCTCSPDFNKDKKSSSGYRSMVLNGGSEEGQDDLDASGGTSGIRSSEPGDEFAMVHPVACFSPIHGNDIIRKTCLPVANEEITFI